MWRQSDLGSRFLLTLALVVTLRWVCLTQTASGMEPPTCAWESKPVAVVSLASFNTLTDRYRYLGKLSHNPAFGLQNKFLINLLVSTWGVQGLDKDRPWGVVLGIDEAKLVKGGQAPGDCLLGYGFVPFDDFPLFRECAVGAGLPLKDLGGGVFQIKEGETSLLYIKHAGKWVYLARTREELAHVAPDPDKLLGDLPSQYDLAIRFEAANLPESLRRKAIEAFQGTITETSGGIDAGTRKDDTFGKMVNDLLIGMATRLVTETDSVTIAGALNKGGKTFYDVKLVARPGTVLHEKLTKWELQSNGFAGFLQPDATLSAGASFRFIPPERSELNAAMTAIKSAILEVPKKENLDPQESALREETADTLLGIFQQCWTSGRIEGGVSIYYRHGSLQLMCGGFVPGGDKLEKLLRDSYHSAAKADPKVQLHLNVDKVGDIRLHTMTVPNLKDVPKYEQVVIGTSPDALYCAVGEGSLAALKEALNRSKRASAEKSPPKVTLDLRWVLTERDNSDAGGSHQAESTDLAKMLQSAGDRCHVFLTIRPISNGMAFRLEIEEGFLRALEAAP